MGTRPEQAAADHSSQAANPEAVFPLRHFHRWIAVVRHILGPLTEISLRAYRAQRSALCAKAGYFCGLPGRRALPQC
jgi:hypothetical protein